MASWRKEWDDWVRDCSLYFEERAKQGLFFESLSWHQRKVPQTSTPGHPSPMDRLAIVPSRELENRASQEQSLLQPAATEKTAPSSLLPISKAPSMRWLNRLQRHFPDLLPAPLPSSSHALPKRLLILHVSLTSDEALLVQKLQEALRKHFGDAQSLHLLSKNHDFPSLIRSFAPSHLLIERPALAAEPSLGEIRFQQPFFGRWNEIPCLLFSSLCTLLENPQEKRELWNRVKEWIEKDV